MTGTPGPGPVAGPIPPLTPSHPLLAHVDALRRRGAARRFAGALLLPWRAFGFLAAHRRLWPLVALPALINAVFFVAALVLLVGRVDDLLALWWAQPAADGLLGWLARGLWTVVWLLAAALGVVLSYVAVLLVGGIVASPFNDVLSERTEHALTGRAVPDPGESVLGGALRAVGSALVITLAYGLLMVPVLLLNLVPVAGSLAAALVGGLLGAFFVALEYADSTFGRYRLPLRARVRRLRADAALALGFGLGTSLLLAVPLLNFVVIPIAVVGGTAVALVLRPEAAV